MVKNTPTKARDVGTRVQSLGQEDPWRRKWQPTSVFLPAKSHGQRSLVGYSSWDCKESEKTGIEHSTLRKDLKDTKQREKT